MSTALADLLDFTVVDRSTEEGIVRYRGVIPDVFTIGPKVHGGSVQMMVSHVARRALGELAAGDDVVRLGDVTALAVASDYLAAPDPAELDFAVRIVKRGRTVSLARVDVTQGGRLMVTSTVTLGRLDAGEPRHREPTLLDDLSPVPDENALGLEGTPLGEVMHLAPAVDLAIDPDWFPALRGQTGPPVTRGWIRVKDAGAQPTGLDREFPVLVCDISPPVVMNLGLFGWAPTVQLTTYVRRRPQPGWLRFAANSTEVGRGMFAEDHVVVDEAGALVAQSRQLALIPSGA